LEVVEEGAGFDVCILAIGPREDDGTEKSPVPQIATMDRASWISVGADGKVNMPIHPIGADRETRVRKNAETVAKYRRALQLPEASSDDLAGKIEVSFLRMDGSGKWVVAEPDVSSGLVTFEEGDRIGIRVTNKHDKLLFISVFDFGMMYGIRQEYPPEGANDPLAAGKSIDLFTDQVMEWEFDDGFPFASDPTDPTGADGIEIIKVFGSTADVDLSMLQQESTRSAAVPQDRLSQLFQFAVQGGATRKFSRKEEKIEGWTTATIQLQLKRRSAGLEIEPDGKPLEIGDLTIHSNGISGTAEILPTFSDRTRSVELTSDSLEQVLASEHVYPSHALRISNVRTEARTASTRGIGDTVPASSITIDVPDPGDKSGQFVMYTDESGVVSWHVADPSGSTRSLEGAVARRTRTYTISRNAEPEGEQATRGLISAVGQKLVKVFVFPLIDPIIGEVGEYFAAQWEAVKRPYGLRTLTVENRSDPDGDLLTSDDWDRLGKGKSLLFVHGTFSRTHSAFSALPENVLGKLHQQYDGRVFAFDHFTLSQDPKQNIQWLLNRIPGDASLDLDIICHSRGGLVSRTLSEKQSEFSLGSRTLSVGKIVFVASPNAGTRLADVEHIGDLVDTYSNLLNFLPDNPVTGVLDAVITVVKQLAVGALGGLNGLQSMRPGGEFQEWINSAGGGAGSGDGSGDGARYFALAAEYAPKHKGLLEFAKSLAMKAVFEDNNDMVVPTSGVFDPNGSPLFPIEQKRVFGPEAGIAHSNFFSDPQVQEQILSWLK
ncbi:MAG: esterase/lipase family protein, partial [Rhodothermia bacterium]